MKKSKSEISSKELEVLIELIKKKKYIPEWIEIEPLNLTRNKFTYYRMTVEAKKLGYLSKFQFEKPQRHAEKRKQILSHIKDLAAKLGRTPSTNEIDKAGKFNASELAVYFGSIRKAHRLAGLKPNSVGNSHERSLRHGEFITKERCIEELTKLSKRLKRKPSWKDVKKHMTIHPQTISLRLGKLARRYIEYYRFD